MIGAVFDCMVFLAGVTKKGQGRHSPKVKNFSTAKWQRGTIAPPSWFLLTNRMQSLNRTAMARRYAGKWVALREDRKSVVASGDSVQEALRAAQKKGIDRPVMTRMPKTVCSFVGYHHRHGK